MHEYCRETGMSFSYSTVWLPRFKCKWILLLHFLFVWIQHRHLFLHDLPSVFWTVHHLFYSHSYTYLYNNYNCNPPLLAIKAAWREQLKVKYLLPRLPQWYSRPREARAVWIPFLRSRFIRPQHSCLQPRRQLRVRDVLQGRDCLSGTLSGDINLGENWRWVYCCVTRSHFKWTPALIRALVCSAQSRCVFFFLFLTLMDANIELSSGRKTHYTQSCCSGPGAVPLANIDPFVL